MEETTLKFFKILFCFTWKVKRFILNISYFFRFCLSLSEELFTIIFGSVLRTVRWSANKFPYCPRLKDGSKTAFERWIKVTLIKQWDHLETAVYLSCFLDNHCNPLTAAACHKLIKFLLAHTH